MVLPHRASRKEDVSCLIKICIIKRFEFTSQMMKSGAVVVPEDAPADTALLLVKGAPGVIKHMSKPGSIPENFDKVLCFAWRSLGCFARVLLGNCAAFGANAQLEFRPHVKCLHRSNLGVK